MIWCKNLLCGPECTSFARRMILVSLHWAVHYHQENLKKKMQVETYLVVQGYIVIHTYRGDISYTYGRLNPRNVHTYTKKKQKQKNTRIINSPPNPLHPSISMQILHTVLYTFPVVLTRRICLTIKGFLSG